MTVTPIPILSIVGKSNVGKTTLLEKLIPELKRRGYRIATIKHDAHSFQLDQPGKDTYRHAAAGADVVAISSPAQFAIIQKVEREQTLDEVAARITGVDLILTEGYKRERKPKIEVSRRAVSSELLCTKEELLAVVTDQQFSLDVPQFGLDDVTGLADCIETYLKMRRQVG